MRGGRASNAPGATFVIGFESARGLDAGGMFADDEPTDAIDAGGTFTTGAAVATLSVLFCLFSSFMIKI